MKLPPQEISLQPDDTKAILLVSNDEAVEKEVTTILQGIPKHTLQTQTGTLSGLNGMAVDFARSNDLIIFQTTTDRPSDLDAIEILREELDQQIKLIAITKEDITLADARRISRSGADEVLTYPLDIEELREQVVRLTSPNPLVVVPPTPTTDANGTVMVVSKANGGIGATTVAVNLADQLRGKSGGFRKKTGAKVIVVDLDLQFGAVASFLDVAANNAMYQLAQDGTVPDATFLQQSILTSKSGIDVFCAPERFAPLSSLSVDQVGAMIDALRDMYDHVVIDLPHALVEWIAPVLEKADRVLMVTDSAVPSIQQARRLLDFYTTENVGLPVDMVINREKKPMVKGGAYREAQNVLERQLKHWLPPDAKTARAAVDRGQPLSEVSRRSPLTKAIASLAKTLSEDIEATRQSKTQTRPAGKIS